MPTSRSASPRLLITLGDPAGVGPEVTIKALREFRKKSSARVLVLGDAGYYNRLARRLAVGLRFFPVEEDALWKRLPKGIACYSQDRLPSRVVYGKAQKALTRLAVRSIRSAAKLLMEKQADALVTAPINKAGLKAAGFSIPGHTEYLAALSKTKSFEMMLIGGPLRVVPVTRHVPLKDVSRKILRKKLEESIRLTHVELKRSFGIPKPRIVVAGLNPHAGERGTIGREELETILPAVRNARKKTGAKVLGPLSPDALFCDAYEGRYDAEVCMYHDQGLIPLKMISRGSGVNVTLGLPFVRTSPDHGTAYDIAPRFTANPGSMLKALEWAVILSRNRARHARS